MSASSGRAWCLSVRVRLRLLTWWSSCDSVPRPSVRRKASAKAGWAWSTFSEWALWAMKMVRLLEWRPGAIG